MSIGPPHPDPIVETSSLSAVQPPEPTYELLTKDHLETSKSLSCLQIETLVYACQVAFLTYIFTSNHFIHAEILCIIICYLYRDTSNILKTAPGQDFSSETELVLAKDAQLQDLFGRIGTMGGEKHCKLFVGSICLMLSEWSLIRCFILLVNANRDNSRWISVGSDLKYDARRDLDDVGAKCIEGIYVNLFVSMGTISVLKYSL